MKLRRRTSCACWMVMLLATPGWAAPKPCKNTSWAKVDPAKYAMPDVVRLWADDRLSSYPYFVTDLNPKLQTRVTSPFGQFPGKIRWRVWAFGGNDLTISAWRSVVMHE